MKYSLLFLMLIAFSTSSISSVFLFQKLPDGYSLKINVSEDDYIEYLLSDEFNYYFSVEQDLTMLNISLNFGGVKKSGSIALLANDEFDFSAHVENAQSIEGSGYCLDSKNNFIVYNDVFVDRAILGTQGLIVSVGGDKDFLLPLIIDTFPEMEGCLGWL